MQNKKTYRKYAVSTMAAAAAVAGVAPVASAAESTNFPDVTQESVPDHYDAIMELADQGVIKGFEDGTFGPWQNVSRAQVAAMLTKAMDLNVPSDLGEALNDYKDISATHQYAEQIAAVTNAGIFKGNLQGNFQPYTDITREQMATVLVEGLNLDEYEAEKVDINLDNVTPDHADNIQVLANLGITVETEDFRPFEKITRAAFSTMMVKAMDVIAPSIESLGSVSDVTVDQGTAVEDVELPETVEATYDDGSTADVAVDWDTSKVDTSEVGTYAVTGSVEGTDETVSANVIVRATEVTVESVSAINAEEILVTFSDDVTETAANQANYEISKNGTKLTSDKIADIKVNGNTALLRLKDSAKTGDRYVVQTNDSIISKDGKPVEKFASEEYVYADGPAPSLENTSVVQGEDSVKLRLQFDRPVQKIDNDQGEEGTKTLIKVDDVEIDSNDLTESVFAGEAGNYFYDVDINNEKAQELAVKEGKHKVVIFDIQDTAAENPVVSSVLKGSYEITKDATVPEVAGIQVLNGNKFFIKTNRPVEVGDGGLKVEKGVHQFIEGDLSSSSSLVYEEGSLPDGTPGVYVVITDSADDDANPLYKNNETSVDLKVTLENYKAEGSDLVGTPVTEDVTVSKDDTKPSVKTTTIAENGNINVTFNGTIDEKPEANDLVIKDKDGVVKSVDDENITLADSSQNKVDDVVTISGDFNEDAPYTVEFKDGALRYEGNSSSVSAYDVPSKKNDAITVTAEPAEGFKYVAFGDLTDATIDYVEKNVIKVNYETEMTDSAREVSNYKLDDEELPEGTKVEFVGDKETVHITIPEGTVKYDDNSYKLAISSDVTTKDNKHVVKNLQTKGDYDQNVTLYDNVKPELEKAVYLVESDDAESSEYIKLTFTEGVEVKDDQLDADDNFTVVVNGSTQTASVADDVTPEDNELVLKLGSEVSVSQEATITLVEDSKGNMNITDVSDLKNEAKVDSFVKASTTKVDKTLEEN
ncbi:S-layer homology domain-containing protein [Virgibacillus sp. FSP13]